MNENTSKRKDWVKNAAIIFLSVMLVLTFFSNTIMNYSLPEVATQYVQRGSITAKVRGTGKVEATDPYHVKVKESRVIAGVAVKQGDTVEKDQVLYYLEDEESEELQKAQAELEDLKLAYMKGLFGNNVSPEIINKVANGNVDSFAALRNKVTDMQNRLEAAQDRIKECQENLDKLTLESTINTNDSTVNTLPQEYEKAQAATDLAHAQTAETNAQAVFDRQKAENVAALQNMIAEKQKQIADLEMLVDEAEDIAGNVGGTIGTGGIDVYVEQRKAAREAVKGALKRIYDAAKLGGISGIPEPEPVAFDENTGKFYMDNDSEDAKRKEIEKLLSAVKHENDYQTLIADYNAAVSQWRIVSEMAAEAGGALNNYNGNAGQLAERQQELANLQAQLNALNAITYTPGDGVNEAQKKLDEATRVLTELTNANKQSAVAYQNKVASAQTALKNAQAVYELLKEEQTKMTSDINAELDLAKVSQDIAEKEEKIEKLKEKSVGASIHAPVAGTVTNLAYTAGETTKPEEDAAVIQVDGKGYTLTVSVTNEQAKKVQVGDTAELQNSWYYEDAQIILAAIKPDPDNPGQKRLLVFDVKGGNIQSGQTLSVSVGQRSAEYELVVPNSAVREDNNGKFILIVESKSSPLGNRYIATRIDVEVLTSDDKNTAISAPLNGYEYVITTSTKPIEAGKQVRLNGA